MREPGPVTLLTRWHLGSMRGMLSHFWRLRRLDHATQHFPGRRWSHRWISRRSLLYTSTWESDAYAEAWLTSDAFRSFDARMRAAGAESHIERYSRHA